MTQGRSPVREFRSLGSARGAPGNRGPYRKRVESRIISIEVTSTVHSLNRPFIPQIDRSFPKTTTCSQRVLTGGAHRHRQSVSGPACLSSWAARPLRCAEVGE
jgi:hypothetical protein